MYDMMKLQSVSHLVGLSCGIQGTLLICGIFSANASMEMLAEY